MIKSNYSTTKNFENPNARDIKSVTIEYPKTSFFYLGFLSQPFANHRAAGEGRARRS